MTLSSSHRRILAAVGLVGMILGAAVLRQIPPGAGGPYPTCLFHEVTGLLCPGCGAARALHQLLHGHLAPALRLNPLVVLLLPVWGWPLLSVAVHAIRGRPLQTRRLPPPELVWGILAAILAFWVLRNLPFEVFRLLRPGG